MPVKINYMTKGFVECDNFKKLYDDLITWRRENAFKEKNVKKISVDAD